MATDSKGHVLELGDRVFVRGVVIGHGEGEDTGRVHLQLEDPGDVGGNMTAVVHAGLTEKIHFEEHAGGYRAPAPVESSMPVGVDPGEAEGR